jgi:hypothetical protein
MFTCVCVHFVRMATHTCNRALACTRSFKCTYASFRVAVLPTEFGACMRALNRGLQHCVSWILLVPWHIDEVAVSPLDGVHISRA